MQASAPVPRPARVLARLARWALALVLALWLLAAVGWGLLHGWIVPRIDQWRIPLQTLAARQLGVSVQIGALRAQPVPGAVLPRIELENVLLGGTGDDALRLPQVVVTLSPRALLRRGVEQIHIDGAQLAVRRTPDGALHLAGLPIADLHAAGPGLPDAASRTSRAENAAHAATPLLHWLLAQPELVLRGATLLWHEADSAAHGEPPLPTLHDVQAVLRNSRRIGIQSWQHHVRIDASPPAHRGTRFTLMGQLRSSAFARFGGTLYGEVPRIDFAPLAAALAPYFDMQALPQGQGALRAWLDLRRSRAQALRVDVALERVQWPQRAALPPWQLRHITARVEAQYNPQNNGDWRVQVHDLAFASEDGLHWPPGTLRARWQPGKRHGQLQLEAADLGVLAQLAQRLGHKLPWQVAGQARHLQLDWQGDWNWRGTGREEPAEVPDWRASGTLHGLTLMPLAPEAARPVQPAVGLVGVEGLDAQFSLTRAGGTAHLRMRQSGPSAPSVPPAPAALSFPGVFAEARIPLHTLDATLHWQLAGDAIDVRIPDLRFANQDAAGEAQIHWRSGAQASARFPGVLDLQGRLTRADATRVWRYLPLGIAQQACDYVRHAIRAGHSRDVRFRVRGALQHLPFSDPQDSGEFHIAARVDGVQYDYAPAALLPPGAPAPWPALHALAGELIFDKAAMHVRAARAQQVGTQALALHDIRADIADLSNPVVQVQAQATAALADLLTLANTPALAPFSAQALEGATASGNAHLALQLHLPVEHWERSRVQGRIALQDNRLQLTAAAPVLQHLRGSVAFSETGFALEDISAQALGGALRAAGGMQFAAAAPPDAPVQIRIEGNASAAALRQQAEMQGDDAAGLRAFLQHAAGEAAYTLRLGLHGGALEIDLRSSLHGLALHLPAPLGKSASALRPMHWTRRIVPAAAENGTAAAQEHITLHWRDGENDGENGEESASTGGALHYARTHGASDAWRGSIHIGPLAQAPAALPARGVQASLELPRLDIDDWLDWLARQPSSASSAAAQTSPWLPDQWTLRAARLSAGARPWRDVALHMQHSAQNAQNAAPARWRGSIRAQELDGQFTWQPGDAHEPAGCIHVELARLNLPPASPVSPGVPDTAPATDNTAPDASIASDTAAHASLPALHIRVQALQRAGHPLGQLQLLARNRMAQGGTAQWQLERFDIDTPEAQWRASGHWEPKTRQSQFTFALQLQDGGKLLERLGMAGVFAKGHGTLHGSAQWRGAPLSPHWPSLSGTLRLDVHNGQFLKAEPGLAKLLGVLSLQSLPRRLALDFRDVFSNGFAFDFLRGDAHIARGTARTDNLKMQGVNAVVLMDGSADLLRATQDVRVVVIPEINAMTASLAAAAVNPVVGLGSFVAQALLRKPLAAAATREFRITGDWAEPQVTQLPRRAADGPLASEAASPPPGARRPY